MPEFRLKTKLLESGPKPVSLDMLHQFASPDDAMNYQINNLITSVTAERSHQEKYKRALFIGRFQPFHTGHLTQVLLAAEIAEHVILGIGSANIWNTPDNPFSAETRELLIWSALERYPQTKNKVSIVYINDFIGDDDEWLNETINKTGKVDVVVGNNRWVNDLLRTIGVPSIEKEFERTLFEGSRIRAALRANGWNLNKIRE